MGHYTLMRKGGKTVAGNLAAMNESQPSVWVSYVSVDSADATVELAKKAGAMVFVEPMDVSDIGRMAIFADPTGAAIGVWQPKTFIGAELPTRSTCSRGTGGTHGTCLHPKRSMRKRLAGGPTTSTMAGAR